jgi:hypothetical protein
MSNLPIWAQAALLRSREVYEGGQYLCEALGLDKCFDYPDYLDACEEFWANVEAQQALAPVLAKRLWEPLALLRATVDDVARALSAFSDCSLPSTKMLTAPSARAIKARAIEWRYGSAIEFADAAEAGLLQDAEVYRIVNPTALRANAGRGLDALEREVRHLHCYPMWVWHNESYFLVVIPRDIPRRGEVDLYE